ncbi:hypothetical protein ACHAW6_001143 [Cyclotella cf. meneghiniana]
MKDTNNLPSNTSTFLDLEFTITEGNITTKTHKKEGNPYLYFRPQSAHPPGMIKGVIFGLIHSYQEAGTLPTLNQSSTMPHIKSKTKQTSQITPLLNQREISFFYSSVTTLQIFLTTSSGKSMKTN